MTWDKALFPNPEKLQNDIASRGRKMVTIVDPHIKRDTAYPIFKNAEEKGYYVKNKDGKDYDGYVIRLVHSACLAGKMCCLCPLAYTGRCCSTSSARPAMLQENCPRIASCCRMTLRVIPSERWMHRKALRFPLAFMHFSRLQNCS